MESKYIIKLVENRIIGLRTAIEIFKEKGTDLDISELDKERDELIKWLIKRA